MYILKEKQTYTNTRSLLILLNIFFCLQYVTVIDHPLADVLLHPSLSDSSVYSRQTQTAKINKGVSLS